MPVIGWRSYRAPTSDGSYVVLASRLVLAQHRMVPAMLRMARAVQAELDGADGLLGYSLDAQVRAKTFQTVSAWESRDALDAFAGSGAHAQVAARLREHLSDSVFVDWESTGEDLDVSWEHANRQLARAADGR